MTHEHHDHDVVERAGKGCCCGSAKAAPATDAAKDPVCGMTVDPAKTQHHAEHAGTAYHFCSAGCRTKFEADPARYLAPKPDANKTAVDPVCGMKVDPAKTQHHAEHAGMAYHFCCNGCRTKFESEPDKYLAPKVKDLVCA